MGLVKTRRLAAMQKARLRGGYGGLKAGLESCQLKVTTLRQSFEYLKKRKLLAPTSLPSNRGMEMSPS